MAGALFIAGGFWLIIALAIWLIIALATGAQADKRGMSQWGGILLGLILGPLGLAIVLLMPSRK
jgi:hypothetical protein